MTGISGMGTAVNGADIGYWELERGCTTLGKLVYHIHCYCCHSVEIAI